MINFIQRFFNSEDGAVTVDWVVLTALVVGLAVASFTSVDGGASALTAALQAFLLNITVG